MIKQPRVKSWHAHQNRGAGHEVDYLLCVELWEIDHRCTCQYYRVGGHKQAVGVIGGQCMDKNIIGREAPNIHQRFCVRQ